MYPLNDRNVNHSNNKFLWMIRMIASNIKTVDRIGIKVLGGSAGKFDSSNGMSFTYV